MMHVQMGSETMATFDGRLAREAFCGGSDPVSGRDVNGPTASILSTTEWPQECFPGGVAVNLRLNLRPLDDKKRENMAKAFGARVITTVMNDELEAKIAHLPADIVVNTSKQSLADVMKAELEAGRGVDICVDCLGGATVGECLPYMNFDGRWIMIATLADDFTNVNMRSMYARRTRLIGTNLRSRTPAQKKQLLSEMTEMLWPKVESGQVRPTIYKVFPIEQAEEAQALMQSGKSAGKIVLVVREEQ